MPKHRREPVRTCVACRQEAGKGSLLRIVRGAAGAATLDLTGRASGRGAYLHQDPKCIETALKKRVLERALSATVTPDLWAALSSPAERV